MQLSSKEKDIVLDYLRDDLQLDILDSYEEDNYFIVKTESDKVEAMPDVIRYRLKDLRYKYDIGYNDNHWSNGWRFDFFKYDT